MLCEWATMFWNVLCLWTFLSTGVEGQSDTPSTSNLTKAASSELFLLKTLFNEYSVNVQPYVEPGNRLEVALELTPNQLLDVVEKNQVIYGNYWRHLYWRDPFLTWEPKEHGNLTTIYVNVDRIWRPDITLVNDVSIDRRPVEALYLAEVKHTGDVVWVTPHIYHSSCILDMTYYPFDHQFCYLNFTSFVYDNSVMRLVAIPPLDETISNAEKNGEWHYRDFCVKTLIIRHLMAQASDEREFSHVRFRLWLERKPLFSFYNVILPSIFTTFCTFLVFLLPPDSGEKVAMAVTMLLSTTFYLLLVADYLPSQSDVIPTIGKYFLSAIVLLVLSTAGTVMVLYVHFQGALRYPPPPIMSKVILDWLATAVFMRKKVILLLVVRKDRRKSKTLKERRGTITTGPGRQSVQLDPQEDVDPMLSWILAAMILDRVYLCTFTLVTVGLTAALIVHHPRPDTEEMKLCR